MTPRTTRHALLTLAALAAFTLLAPDFPGARIAVATGGVEVGRGEPPLWKVASAGEPLAPGDRVRTGNDGRAEIALEGSSVRLYPNSMLRLPEASEGAAAVELERGTSLFDVLRRGEPFEIRTPQVVVSVKGTRFAVALDRADAAAVSVFRGLVGVRSSEPGPAQETLVQAGFAAFGSDHFELVWHGADDPWESWGHGGAAPDPFAGRGARRDAALLDARAAALALSRELPGPPKGGDDGGMKAGETTVLTAPADQELVEPKIDLLRDAVSDADAELEQALREEFVETYSDDLLSITFVDGSGSSGPDSILLADDSGNQWILEQDDIEGILAGSESLPADLAALLDAGGEDADALLTQLQAFFP